MQMAKTLNSVLLVFAVSVPCVGTAGELYKWVDDDGHVHYSDIENLPDTPTYVTPVDAQITIIQNVQVEKSESEISTTSPSSSSSTLLRSRQVDENSEAKKRISPRLKRLSPSAQHESKRAGFNRSFG
ncbi:DUF4124 domain-containing protein [Teredinibacter turnerae]|uniref:DUF4124 domain-containing protein n=1 Tax=Teredinibacter turnerae TaxID=2426 RepID=UPI00036D0FB5